MGPRVIILAVFVAVLCVVAQGLKCNFCKSIDKKNPTCDQIEQHECQIGLTHCTRIVMREPAYGEVRRCASSQECEATVPHLVERTCCTSDLCNHPMLSADD